MQQVLPPESGYHPLVRPGQGQLLPPAPALSHNRSAGGAAATDREKNAERRYCRRTEYYTRNFRTKAIDATKGVKNPRLPKAPGQQQQQPAVKLPKAGEKGPDPGTPAAK